MNVRVNDPERWAIQTFFGGTKFEQAHNVSIAIGLNLYVCVNGSGMGIGKVEHKSLPCFVFSK